MKGKRTISLEGKKRLEGMMFVSPWVVGFLAFFAFPLIVSIQLSFGDIRSPGSLATNFVGLANFERAFVEDINFVPMFLSVVKLTLIRTPMILLFSLIIAIMLNKNMLLRGVFRQIFFLPVLLGTGFIMQQLIGQKVDQQAMEVARGILLPDEVLLYLGPKVAQYVGLFLDNITIVLWKSGVQIILFLAGLQGISRSLYESARVDSATEWEMFWKITLPMISPVILLNIVYSIVDSFTDVTNPMVNYVYSKGFTDSQFEYAAAMGWIYMGFVAILIGIVFLMMRRFVRNVS